MLSTGVYFSFQIIDENVVPGLLQRALMGICCILVILIHYQLNIVCFLIFPSEMDVRLVSV